MLKKPPSKKKKRKSPESVQSFLPIKDIRNGIIETTDGRYIKIIESNPLTLCFVPVKNSIISSHRLQAG